MTRAPASGPTGRRDVGRWWFRWCVRHSADRSAVRRGSSASPDLLPSQLRKQIGRHGTATGADRAGVRTVGDRDDHRLATGRALRQRGGRVVAAHRDHGSPPVAAGDFGLEATCGGRFGRRAGCLYPGRMNASMAFEPSRVGSHVSGAPTTRGISIQPPHSGDRLPVYWLPRCDLYLLFAG